MPQPEVSVVIPAYNAERTLAATLQSVLGQSFENFEVIVVDDGSRDATGDVAASTGDPRVRVLSVANGGVSRARNRGMDAATGESVALLDADDLWAPEKLKRQVALLRARPEIGMCFTAAYRIDGASRQLGEMPAREYGDYTRALLLYSMVIGCCSSGMFRRVLVSQVGGFDPTFSQSADWDFWLRLSRVTRFGRIPEPLVMYRTHPGQMSTDIFLLEQDTFAVLRKLYAQPEFSPYLPIRSRVESNHWMICSGSYLHARRPASAVRCMARGLWAHPGSLRRLAGWPVRLARRRIGPSKRGAAA